MATPTPLDWVKLLANRILRQRQHARVYDPYYSGEHKLEIVERDFREVFGVHANSAYMSMLQPARVNLSRVAVEALAERLVVEGFHVGEADDQDAADAARRIWYDNDLDEMSGIAHTEAGIKGAAFTLVWPDPDGDPVISIEDVEQVAVARRSSPPYDVIAGLKIWLDEWTGDEFADLYLPDLLHRFKRRGTGPIQGVTQLILPTSSWETGVSPSWSDGVTYGNGGLSVYGANTGQLVPAWIPTTFDGGDETIKNGFGEVPITELCNRGRLLRPPTSELVDVTPLHDASDKLLGDLIIAASFGAVPVRYATGLKILSDSNGKPVDEKGNPVVPIDVRADRFLTSPDPASRFGTLDGSNLEGFVKASNEIMARFRTVTRVPYHYIDMGGTSGVTGETLKAFEGPLVRRVNGIERRVGSGWRKTQSLALDLTPHAGKPVKTIWADTETRAEVQQADAFSKLISSGTPFEIACEKILGWPRELIQRALKLREETGLAIDQQLANLRKDVGLGMVPGASPVPRGAVANTDPAHTETTASVNAT